MKNLIGLLILIGLLVAAYFLYQNKGGFNKPQEDFKDFAIKDTAKIDQIFISELNGDKVTISRKGGKRWLVDGEYPARPDAIKLILKTVYNIEIQSPVSKEYKPSIIKRLATNAVKVEFYTGTDEPEKVWYISHATGNKEGTYMLLEKGGEKSLNPYITHLLMERGSLRSRFFARKKLWRDREMLKMKPQKIKSIEVIHGTDSLTSFIIKNIDGENFEATNLESQETIPVPHEIAIPYFKLFSGVYYEYMDIKTPVSILDSIYSLTPRHKVNVTDEKGETVTLKTFNLPVREGSLLAGKPITVNPERMYGFSSELGENEFPIVQNHTFDALFPSFEYFASSTTVEK